MGKGIREFKKNIHEGVNETASPPRVEPSASPQSRESGTRVDEELRTEPKRLL
jgi:Sec-independent protein translocase protein TatA